MAKLCHFLCQFLPFYAITEKNVQDKTTPTWNTLPKIWGRLSKTLGSGAYFKILSPKMAKNGKITKNFRFFMSSLSYYYFHNFLLRVLAHLGYTPIMWQMIWRPTMNSNSDGPRRASLSRVRSSRILIRKLEEICTTKYSAEKSKIKRWAMELFWSDIMSKYP